MATPRPIAVIACIDGLRERKGRLFRVSPVEAAILVRRRHVRFATSSDLCRERDEMRAGLDDVHVHADRAVMTAVTTPSKKRRGRYRRRDLVAD